MKRYYLMFALLVIFIIGGCSPSESESQSDENDKENGITVLMYHHFDENEDNTNSVTMTPDRFRDQLTTLLDAGYTSISETDLYNFYYNEGELPEKPLLITIDDGYYSNYEFAYPILEELEMYATIYVVTSFRGETPGSNPHFTWDDAREMSQSEWIDVQSHTHNAHFYVEGKKKEGPFLTTKIWDGEKEETDEEYRARIHDDLKKSKDLITEELDNDFYTLAYPYGGINDTVTEVATELGFELMYTVRKNLNDSKTSPYEINRINADGTFTGEKLLKEIQKY